MKTCAAWMTALGLTLWLAGCADRPVPGFCAEARPMRPGSQEVVAFLFAHDPEPAAEILARNEHGARRCGRRGKEE